MVSRAGESAGTLPALRSLDALIQSLELKRKLFATNARTPYFDDQRMRSLQNQVGTIAPEQYQKRVKEFLNSLTVDTG